MCLLLLSRCRRSRGRLGLLALASSRNAVHLVLAVLLDEVGEILDGPGASVLDRLFLGAGGIETDRRESGDRVGDIVGGGINLGNGDLGGEITGVEGTELVVLGSKSVQISQARELVRQLLTTCSVRTTGRRTPGGHPCRSQ